MPNISVCDNYISPYFFATCIQYNSAILFISRLLTYKYCLIRNISSAYQTIRRKYGMQCRSRCNIFNSFRNALLFRYIYKGKLVKMSENIAFLFYKEIDMKYLILYYNSCYFFIYTRCLVQMLVI